MAVSLIQRMLSQRPKFDLEWAAVQLNGTKAQEVQRVREMTSTFTHIAAVVAGLAIFVTGFTVSPRGLLKGLIPALALGVAAALLITAVRSLG